MMIDGVSAAQTAQIKTDARADVAYTAPASPVKTDAQVSEISKQSGTEPKDEKEKEEKNSELGEQKKPSATSVDSAISSANNKMTRTRCEYSYDEATNRVSIKVFDKDNDKLIREVPSEKALEMLQKVMELAGMMVDEKR